MNKQVPDYFIPIDHRAYGYEDFYSRDIFSDVAWCGICGEKIGGVFGDIIEANMKKHRKICE